MKKFLEYLQAIFVPSKMIKLVDLSVLIPLIILLFTTLLSAGSSMVKSESFVKKSMLSSNFEEIDNEIIKLNDLELTISDEQKLVIKLPTDHKGIYNKTLRTNTEQNYDVTIVFDPNLKLDSTEKKLTNFDLEGYYKQTRKDNTTYLLYIFTESFLYYVYDLDQQLVDDKYQEIDYASSVFETETIKVENPTLLNRLQGTTSYTTKVYYLPKDETELKKNEFGEWDTTVWTEKVDSTSKKTLELDGENVVVYSATRHKGTYEYYLPKDETELVKNESGLWDKSLWTEKVTEGQEPENATKVINNETFSAEKRYSLNVNEAVYTRYSIDTLISGGFDFEKSSPTVSVREMIVSIYDVMVYITADSYKLAVSIFCCFVFIVVPLLLACLGWIFGHKNGMKRFKNYLTIASLASIPFSIALFIIGWFMTIMNLMMFVILLGVIWYFVFLIYRINSKIQSDRDKEINENKDQQENQNDKHGPLKFRKLDDDSARIG